jgi:hypothetical protein
MIELTPDEEKELITLLYVLLDYRYRFPQEFDDIILRAYTELNNKFRED